MRKVILTESQAKLLLEEIDKNDSIQKLIFCEPSDIKFNVSDGEGYCMLMPVIDGKIIGQDYLKIVVNEVNIGKDRYYQLGLDVNKDLRRLGIAYKIYAAFVLQDYPLCELFEEGTGSFANAAISGLWAKIANEPGIIIDDLVDENGNKIGLKAYCDSL